MIDIGAVTNVLTKNSVCLIHLIIDIKMEEFDFFWRIALNWPKITQKKFQVVSISPPNIYKTVCVKAINLQWK